jgi:hypothetical protein
MSLLAAKLASPRIRASTYHTDRNPRLCGHRRSWAKTARTTPGPERTSHYGILRTVEDMYGLAHAGASASAAPITNVWK